MVCKIVSQFRERTLLQVLRDGGVVGGVRYGASEEVCLVGTLQGNASSSSLLSSSESTGIEECAADLGTLGSGAWTHAEVVLGCQCVVWQLWKIIVVIIGPAFSWPQCVVLLHCFEWHVQGLLQQQ